MLVVMVGICAIQFLFPRLPLVSRTAIARRVAGHQRLYGLTLFVLGAFLLWSANHGFFSGFAGRAITSALEYILTGSGQAGASIVAQGGSVLSIGGSLTEVFLKLFFAHLVVTVLATALIATVFSSADRPGFRTSRRRPSIWRPGWRGSPPCSSSTS